MTTRKETLVKLDYQLNESTYYRAAHQIAEALQQQSDIDPYQMPTIPEIIQSMRSKIPFSVNCDRIQYKFYPNKRKLVKVTHIPTVNP